MNPSLSKPIQPVYPGLAVNDPIELYSGELEVRYNGTEVRAPGWLRVHFLPSPQTRFELHSPTGASEAMTQPSNFLKAAKLWVPKYQRELDCVVTHLTPSWSVPESSPKRFTLGGALSGSAATSDASTISELHLPVVNLGSYRGTWVGTTKEENEKQQVHGWAGRLVLEADCWRITLDSGEDCEEIIKALRDTGGFGITHNGMIEQTGREPFGAKDADEILSALNYFLSFWRGQWCGAVASIGYDANGQEVWRQLHVARLSQWSRETRSWSSDHVLANEQGQAFAGFWKLWQDQEWSDTLKVAIHWYIESNRRSGGMEGALVLAHTALEMLAWAICGVKGRIVRRKKVDRIHMLLKDLGVPTELGPRYDQLQKASKELKWNDGPEAVAKLRNLIVHRAGTNLDKLNRVSNRARYEAWQLALEYLALVLLKQCKYSGRYLPRMAKGWAGAVEKLVPWAEG